MSTNSAQVGGLDVLAPAELLERRPLARSGTARTIRSWASEIQISVYDRPWYLSGARLELDLGAELRAHLADRRAEAAGAAVGDGAEEPPVARLDDHVEHHLLGDGVADLDGAARDALAVRRSARPS